MFLKYNGIPVTPVVPRNMVFLTSAKTKAKTIFVKRSSSKSVQELLVITWNYFYQTKFPSQQNYTPSLLLIKNGFFDKWKTKTTNIFLWKVFHQSQSRIICIYPQITLSERKVNKQFKLFLLLITAILNCLSNTVNDKLMITSPC